MRGLLDVFVNECELSKQDLGPPVLTDKMGRPLPKLCTANQLGEALQVSGRTIFYWEARGLITAALRKGRTVRFDPEAVGGQNRCHCGKVIRKVIQNGTTQRRGCGECLASTLRSP